MPHDKNGQLLSVGDTVVVEYVLTDVQTGIEYCNMTGETVEPMYPGTHKTTTTFNGKQVVKKCATDVAPTMSTAGLSFFDVETYARKCIKLLQAHGEDMLDIVSNGFKAFRALTGRDFMALFAALNEVNVDVQKVIAAIRQEFGLTE